MLESEFILIVGPMCSKKSGFIIENYADKDIECFKPDVDTRDGAVIKSRAYKRTIPCTMVSSLRKVQPTKPIVILDEMQFFNAEELKDFVMKCKAEHRQLVAVGLDRLANKNEWGTYTAVKELCDVEIKLKAKCDICKQPAGYTALISGNKQKAIQIEGEATYSPRCFFHME